jgi:hypothetical protein
LAVFTRTPKLRPLGVFDPDDLLVIMSDIAIAGRFRAAIRCSYPVGGYQIHQDAFS